MTLQLLKKHLKIMQNILIPIKINGERRRWNGSALSAASGAQPSATQRDIITHLWLKQKCNSFGGGNTKLQKNIIGEIVSFVFQCLTIIGKFIFEYPCPWDGGLCVPAFIKAEVMGLSENSSSHNRT